MTARKGTAQTLDDGAYDHLRISRSLPEVRLPATTGELLDIVAASAFTVIFLYPMTGTPGQSLPEGWLELPGAFGCSAESCGYRDLGRAVRSYGRHRLRVSTQTTSQQREFAERERLNYPLLSDSEHRLVDALKLPLLEVAGHPPRIKRATLIVDHERVVREVMYPVPDPGANAAEAMAAVAKRVGG